MNKYIVTITPPTPNGDLHVGHIAGPFLSADIFTRVQRLKGKKCYLLSYSDDYQSYLQRKAEEIGVNAPALAKENSKKIQESLSLIDIKLDHWLESYNNPYFEDAVKILYQSCLDKGIIAPKVSLEPYCENCEKWGYESFARGGCNHCSESSDPSQCESCAMAPDAFEMTNLRCVLCNEKVVYKHVERNFLLLPAIAEKLKEKILSSPMRPQLKEWVQKVFAHDRKIKAWGVTRPYESGLKLYADENHRIHTWFMGLAGYLATLKELSEKNANADNPYDLIYDDSTCMVNFLGMDCSYSHVLVYPAQTLLNDELRFKNAFYTNFFLKLDGKDFSTSRNHAIWVKDIVKNACSDSVRFYVSLISPEQSSENFIVEEFWTWRNHIFNYLLPKIFDNLEKMNFDNITSPIVLSESETKIIERWQKYSRYDTFSIKEIASELMEILELLNAKLNYNILDKNLAVLFAILSEPIIPKTSQKLKKISYSL
ncbi:methionine--tRNA ligase [Photorhabdus temperata]|uniref:methionine--tRNA ligase n=1 Tax=Photorhabdus temperata TaxID=574560 RepID=UPI00038A130B|nr:methionine--tRNA ligase [Photorhabdus temperata]EQC00155.1 methionyl-tRNA ligase [Photorhabdus temperata subsp. temperata M1021]